MVEVSENAPLVSIVLNTRNRSRLLSRSIESALNQTYKNFELIIIDGASSDDTKLVVSEFARKDFRIKYHFVQENVSAAFCLNIGFKASNGKYVAILDDDDEFLPTKLEKQVALMEKGDDKLGIVYCWEEFWDDLNNRHLMYGRKKSKGWLYNELLTQPSTGGGTLMLIKKEAIDIVGGYDESIKFGADYQFNINVSKYYMHDFVPEILVKTHWNHIYVKSTTQPGGEINYHFMIEYYEKIISDHEPRYNEDNNKLVNHYKQIISLAIKSIDYKILKKYLVLTITSKMSIRNKISILFKTLKSVISKVLKR